MSTTDRRTVAAKVLVSGSDLGSMLLATVRATFSPNAPHYTAEYVCGLLRRYVEEVDDYDKRQIVTEIEIRISWRCRLSRHSA